MLLVQELHDRGALLLHHLYQFVLLGQCLQRLGLVADDHHLLQVLLVQELHHLGPLLLHGVQQVVLLGQPLDGLRLVADDHHLLQMFRIEEVHHLAALLLHHFDKVALLGQRLLCLGSLLGGFGGFLLCLGGLLRLFGAALQVVGKELLGLGALLLQHIHQTEFLHIVVRRLGVLLRSGSLGGFCLGLLLGVYGSHALLFAQFGYLVEERVNGVYLLVVFLLQVGKRLVGGRYGVGVLPPLDGEVAQSGYDGHDDVCLHGFGYTDCGYLLSDGGFLCSAMSKCQLPLQGDVVLSVHRRQGYRLPQTLDATACRNKHRLAQSYLECTPHHEECLEDVRHIVHGRAKVARHEVNNPTQAVDKPAEELLSVIAHETLFYLVLQSLPAGGGGVVHLVELALYRHVLLVGLACYAEVLAQFFDVLAQAGEHDTGTGTHLVQLLHDILHASHTQHRLNRVLVEPGLLDVLEYHQDNVHASPCVEQLADGLGRYADGLGYVEGVVPDGRDHSRECRCRHLHTKTECVNRSTQSGHLVDTDTALSAHGSDTLHEVGDGRSGGSRVGTQLVDGRSNLLHCHGSSR